MKPKHRSRQYLGLIVVGFAAAALSPFGSQSAQAAAQTWDAGAGTSTWEDPINWSNNLLPSAGAATINTATGFFPVITATPTVMTPTDIVIGTGAAGRLDVRGGTLSTGTGNNVIVGQTTSGVGTLNLADTSGTGGTLTGFATGTGSLNVGGASTTAGRLTLGNGLTSVGTMNMNTSGTLRVEEDAIGLMMGNGGTSTGNFKLDAGTVTINSTSATGIAILGGTNGGDANLSMSGGTVNATGGVWLGDNNAGSQGVFAISGGTFNATSTGTYTGSQAGMVYIGRGTGQGTFTVSGTAAVTFTNANGSNVGYSNTATTGTAGTLTVSGGTFSNTGDLRVGVGQSGNAVTARADGTFNVSGGTANIGGTLQLARGNDSGDLVTGSSTVSGTGALNVSNDLVVAYAGNGNLGQMTISGGTVNVGTTVEKWVHVNQWDTSRGQLTVSGGTLNLNGNTDLRFSTGNSTGASFVTLSSGAITSYSGNGTGSSTTGEVDMNRAGGAVNNTFNLNGGTLTIQQVISTLNTGTAVFNFNGGTLKAANNSANFVDLGGATQTAVVKSGFALIDSNGFNVTIPQALLDGTGGGGLTKSGAGTLTLGATNTYTGATSVSVGKLTVNGSTAAASAVSVSNGATLSGLGTVNGLTTVASGGIIEAGQAGTGKLTLGGGLTFSGTGNVNFGILSSYSASTGVNAGAMSLSGAAGSVVINIASLGTATAGNTYTLLDYTGGSIGGTGYSALTLAALPSRGIGNLVNTGTQVNLQLTSLDYLKWTGSAGTAWNTGDTSWKLNSNNSVTSYINTPGDSVVFDDSTANGVVDVSGADVNPTSVIFNNATTNYTLQGSNAVAGLTSVVKNNGASLTITNANTYSSGTTLNAGILNINNASAIGTGALTIAGGTIDSSSGAITLTTNNTQNWTGDFAFTGTNALNLGTGAVTLGASRIVTTNGTGALTVGGIISGSGMSLTKNGTGTLILGGVNTYNGGTTVNAGTLQINQSTGAAATGTFNLAGGNFTVNASANNFGYAATLNLSADTTFSKIGTAQINYTGTLTGTGNVLNVNTSSSRLYMNGAVSGITQINVTSGAMGFDLNVGNRGGGAAVNVSSGASLWLANSTNAVANNITLNGGTGQGATGALFQEGAGTPTISGTINLASGDSSIGGNSATGFVAVSGQVSGSGALTKIGVNKYTFSGANTYTGGTTVNAGTLAAGVASVANVSGAFGNNSAVTMGNVAGAILNITGFNAQIGSITGGGTAGGNVTLGAATLTTGGDNTSPATYAGAISGTGGFTKIGSGTQILSGANSYSGDTTIDGGTLVANRSNNVDNAVISALGNSQTAHNITVNNGGTLNLAQGDTFGSAITNVLSTLVINAGGVVTNTAGNFTTLGPVVLNGGTLTTAGGALNASYQSYSLSGNVSVGGSVASTISVTGGGNAFNGIHLGTNTTFDVADSTGSTASDLNVSAPLTNRNGSLGGAGGLTKSGAGTMSLTASNSYTGGTTVSAGTLVLSNNSAAGTAGIAVSGASAATLQIDAGITLANNITFSNTNASSSVKHDVAASGTYTTGTSGNLTSSFAGGQADTTAQILDGTSSVATTLEMLFKDTSTATNDGIRRSDVFTTAGTSTDTYVIQLSTGALAADSVLAWLDGGNEWVNAGTTFYANTAFTNLGTYTLGSYGYDSGNVWAVVNHGGSFAAVPEPTSAIVGLLIGAGLLRRRRDSRDWNG